MFEQLMKTLALSLKMEPFIPLNDGSYRLEIDYSVVDLHQHSNWILWETTLPFQFSERYDYRAEAAIKSCMLHAMKKLRSSPSTLTVNKDQQLLVQGKVKLEDCSVDLLSQYLAKHMSFVEQLSDELEQERVNKSINQTVWLP